MQRIDKFLCDFNIGTRKQVKEYIKNGMVSINESVISKPEFHVDEENDIIKFNGEILTYSKFHYYMLNKPQDVVSATTDGKSTTVINLLSDENVKCLSPVGRLDKDTEGLLLITDDGMLNHDLLSPTKHVEKKYEVHLANDISDKELHILEQGVDIGDDKKTLPAKAYRSDSYADTDQDRIIYLIICEGRFHQVKRMLEAVDNEVVFLKRISMGSLVLDENLLPGEYRKLTGEELNNLKNR